MRTCDNCCREYAGNAKWCPWCGFLDHEPLDTGEGKPVWPFRDQKYNAPLQAQPDEIFEAKADGCCPRCGTPGDFLSDGGKCLRCGFSY